MTTDNPAPARSAWVRLLVLVGIVALGGGLYGAFGEKLNLGYLAEQEQSLQDFQRDNSVIVYGLAFVIYVAVTGLSLPGAAILTLVFGWYLGFASAMVVVSFASTAGATLAFLLSRYLLRDGLQRRFGNRLRDFNRNLEREGAFYLFSLRLIPAVPFFVINLVMGLTPMKTSTFWWVSQLGMLPGTAAYVYAGSAVPSLRVLSERGIAGIVTPQLGIAFVVLGLLPLVIRQIMKRIRPSSTEQLEPSE